MREEAAAGLAKRKDVRVLSALNRMLDAPEVKIRVAEAASALLGFSDVPPEWQAGDYKAALQKQFAVPVTAL